MREFEDLPVGFGMALMENWGAAERFAAMEDSAQEAVLRRARAARSKQEMHELVRALAPRKGNG